MLAGSPVHAGIDLGETPYSTFKEWFPRTRGDRPACPCLPMPVDAVPPYTRG